MGAVRIVTIGDSNTSTAFTGYGEGEPWPTRLTSALTTAYPSTTYTLYNKGVGSCHSGHWRSDAAQYLSVYRLTDALSVNPDIVAVMLGTNDVGGHHNSNVPWQTTTQTESNLRDIIATAAAATATNNASGHPLVVLMQPPPATSYTAWPTSGKSYWRSRNSSECATGNLTDLKALVTSLGTELGVPVVSVWDECSADGFDGSQGSSTQNTWLYDGVHLRSATQGLISDWTVAALTPYLHPSGDVATVGATAGDNHITVTWTDGVTGEDAWYVERRAVS